MVSRRRALARSDGASGLRWLDRAPCAPKFLWGRKNEIVTEPPRPRALAGPRQRFPASWPPPPRSLSRTARWDANETSRGEARSFRSYNHLTFDAMLIRRASERASQDGWRLGERRRPVTTSRTERRASTAAPPPPPPTRPPRPHRASTRGNRRRPPPAARPSRPGWAPCPWSCSS